jgi:CRISPR-associated DxTHG motif protein
LGWPVEPPFFVPDEALTCFRKAIKRGEADIAGTHLLDEETGENGRGIKDSTLKNLEIALTAIWQIPIMCLAIDEIICKENAFKLIHTFFNCLSDVDTKGIIIDITHGFRSMPILLMSALQYAENIK